MVILLVVVVVVVSYWYLIGYLVVVVILLVILLVVVVVVVFSCLIGNLLGGVSSWGISIFVCESLVFSSGIGFVTAMECISVCMWRVL